MNHFGLFAKFWQPGSVKTRLAKSIGDQAACKIYRCFVDHLLERHQSTASSRCVVFSPPHKRSEFREAISDHWDLSPQSDGDLGDRMGSYFETRLAHQAGEAKTKTADRDSNKGSRKVVIIGADCPLLDPAIVRTAFDLLDQVPVVIGPSRDGGYCLIAINDQCKQISDLFSDVNWSTPSVLEETVAHLKRLKIEFHLLDPLNDVDEIEDLKELSSELKSRTRDALDEKLLSNIELALNCLSDPEGSSTADPDTPAAEAG